MPQPFDAAGPALRKLCEGLAVPHAWRRGRALTDLTPFQAVPEARSALSALSEGEPDPSLRALAQSALAEPARGLPAEPGRLVARLLVSAEPLYREAALAAICDTPELAASAVHEASELLRETAPDQAHRHLGTLLWELTTPGSAVPATLATALAASLEKSRLERSAEFTPPALRSQPIRTARRPSATELKSATQPAAKAGPSPLATAAAWVRTPAFAGVAAVTALLTLGLATAPETPSAATPAPAVAVARPGDKLFRAMERRPVQLSGVVVKVLPGRRELKLQDDASRSIMEVRLKTELQAAVVDGTRVRVDGTLEGLGAFGDAVVGAETVAVDTKPAGWGWDAKAPGKGQAASGTTERPEPARRSGIAEGIRTRPLR
ncbi:MAG: hypothetical protein HYY25_10660 [Candidatus Wallbacteria bacterium]|nr:hypothetical protein [Candidatus Wallbacteria bacterium]